jgi:hypothetical protein
MTKHQDDVLINAYDVMINCDDESVKKRIRCDDQLMVIIRTLMNYALHIVKGEVRK